jgi:hypothetical protein
MSTRIWQGKADGTPEQFSPDDAAESTGVTRRRFLGATLGAAGGLTALVAALQPLRELSRDDLPSIWTASSSSTA